MEISKRIGSFRLDRWVLALLVIAAAFLGGRSWLHDHPEHNPWAPLDLNDPPGWATQRKLTTLRDDPSECSAVLERSGVEFERLDPAGEGACARPDRVSLTDTAIGPNRAVTTCPVSAALILWLEQGVQPAATSILGESVASVEHLGTFSCRRMYGRDTGSWSEHATGNAIDIAAFRLDSGRRITLLGGWDGEPDEAQFLRAIRDHACDVFGTVLSPDYNAAHADHFHLDQAQRAWTACR